MARRGHRPVPPEALVALRRRLDTLPARHPDRTTIVEQAAALYGVSANTLYRQLRSLHRPQPVRRADRGQPRKVSAAELERWCELIAALKVRTTNKKGRHLSTARALELMQQHGSETPTGLVRLPSGVLTRQTADRYLRQWGYDQTHLTRAPVAVRFQARRSNELWQFDLSPSDLKQVAAPLWSEPGRGAPTLMLYSVVDDRSGVAYQEYRCVYGEDVEGGSVVIGSTTTAADGSFSIRNVPTGDYSLLVTANGYQTARIPAVQVAAGQSRVEVRAALTPAVTGLRVIAVSGEHDCLGRIRRDVNRDLPPTIVLERLGDELPRYRVSTRRSRRWFATARAGGCSVIHCRLRTSRVGIPIARGPRPCRSRTDLPTTNVSPFETHGLATLPKYSRRHAPDCCRHSQSCAARIPQTRDRVLGTTRTP